MNDSQKDIKWNQWLAGVIDGDGYLAIQKNNNVTTKLNQLCCVAVCEITMPLTDEYLLAQIKQKLGGYIRLRSGAKAVRYRLSHQAGIKELISRINGLILNSQRVPQLQALCKRFDIQFIPAQPLGRTSAYTAGFFDADGSIFMSVGTRYCLEYVTQKGILGKINRLANSRGANQVRLSISNKYLPNLIVFEQAFQIGRIREVKQRGLIGHVWEITNEQEILLFLDYVRKNPLRSNKAKRFFLLERYFELKQMNAHLAPPSTQLNKAWILFAQKWYLG